MILVVRPFGCMHFDAMPPKALRPADCDLLRVQQAEIICVNPMNGNCTDRTDDWKLWGLNPKLVDGLL